MRVLIATHHYFDLTGSETFAYTLAKTLMFKGCNVAIYSPYIGGIITEKTLQLGIPVFSSLQEIKEEKFDAIHLSHNLVAIEVRYCFPYTPIIFLSHGVLPFLEQPPLEDLNISKFLAVSEEVKGNLIQRGIFNDNILIFRNMIDTKRFYPLEEINEEPKRVLVNSRRMDQQTLSIVAEACKRLGLEMKFIGNPGNIEWDVEKHINQVDICISLGRGILEAMSCGRAAIVFDYDGGDGLVTVDNIDEIQKCNFSGRRLKRRFSVETLIDEIQKYTKHMGMANRGIVEERFSAEKNVNLLIDIYEKAINFFEHKPPIFDRLNYVKNLITETRSYSFETERRRFDGVLRDKESALREKDRDIGSLKETVSQRDIHISHLEDVVREKEAETGGLRVGLVEKERKIGSLKETISQKDSKIAELSGILSERDEVIEGLNEGLCQRDIHISHLEDVVREKEAETGGLRVGLVEKEGIIVRFNEIVSQKKAHISHLEGVVTEKVAALSHIYRSHGWRALTVYYRVRDKIFPANTKRRLFAKIILNALMKPKGFLGSVNKYSLRKFIYYLKTSEPMVLEGKIIRKLNSTTGAVQKRENGLYQEITLTDSPRSKKQYDQGSDEDYFNFIFKMRTQKSKDYVPISYPYIPETDIKLIAFYLPQFHPIPENDEWWGKGFTEWTNVTAAVPQFVGHYQPRLPGELGFYDLRITEILKRQIQLARQYGIYGFSFHFYWFHGKRLLESPLEVFLSNPELNFPFCLNWVNENWTRRWDGLDQEVLIGQNHSPEDDIAFIEYASKYLKDDRYIRINSKPLLIFYRPALRPNLQKTAGRWREWCYENGIGEIYLACTHSFEQMDPREIGFDAAIEFAPNTYPLRDIRDQFNVVNSEYRGKIFDYCSAVDFSKNYNQPDYKKFRGICPGWDNEARRPGKGIVLANSSPAKYKEWLEHICSFTHENFEPGERLVFVNAWNEWAEAAYLEPDRRYGYAYLHATAQALIEYYRQKVIKKIVCVSHDAHRHGAQLILLNVVRMLKLKFNYEVHVILKSGGELESDFSKCSTVYNLERDYKTDDEKSQLIINLYKLGIREAICNTVVSGDIAKLLHEKGIKTITLVHELPSLIREYKIEKNAALLVEHSWRVVFPSDYVKQKFKTIVEIDDQKTFILPQGLYSLNKHKDNKYEARTTFRNKFSLPEDSKIIIGVGYGDHRKGADIFLEVAETVTRKRSDIFFLWLGNLHPEIEKLTGLNSKFEKNIILVPTQEDVSLFYAAADIYLLTSREDPFPSVVLEAMSVGLPVIGFENAGGFRDVVSEDTGILVPYLDIEKMAEAVVDLISDTEKRTVLGENGSKLIEKSFNYADYVYKLLGLLGHDYKRVSVIIPNYNYARYLKSRLSSIANQTYPIYEIIFLDDGSTDNSVKIAESYLKEELNMRIVKNEVNSGSAFKQWIKGLQMVKGDYVWIAEADDLCEERFLEELVANMEKEKDIILTYCESKQIDENEKVLAENYLDYTNDIDNEKWRKDYVRYGEKEISDTLVIKNTIPNVSAVLFKNINISSIPEEILDFKICGDWFFYVWLLRNGRISYVNRPLNLHRRHNRSVVKTEDRQLHFDEVVGMQEYIMKHFRVSMEARDKAFSYRDYLREYFGLEEQKHEVHSGKNISISQEVSQPGFDDDLVPPLELICDGSKSVKDFKEVGEGITGFLLLGRARLRPNEKVLDVGCGIGRIARPLTKYLSEEGVYEGFDIVSKGISWCREKYKAYPNFHFKSADIFNKHYNPAGKIKSSEFEFDYETETFDVVSATSVFTHMLPRDMENYLKEIARVLKPHGRCMITYFLLNPESLACIDAKLNTIGFPFEYIDGICRVADRDIPEFVVAYDEKFIRDLYIRQGLGVNEIIYGFWSGRKDFLNSLQDVIIAVK